MFVWPPGPHVLILNEPRTFYLYPSSIAQTAIASVVFPDSVDPTALTPTALESSFPKGATYLYEKTGGSGAFVEDDI